MFNIQIFYLGVYPPLTHRHGAWKITRGFDLTIHRTLSRAVELVVPCLQNSTGVGCVSWFRENPIPSTAWPLVSYQNSHSEGIPIWGTPPARRRRRRRRRILQWGGPKGAAGQPAGCKKVEELSHPNFVEVLTLMLIPSLVSPKKLLWSNLTVSFLPTICLLGPKSSPRLGAPAPRWPSVTLALEGTERPLFLHRCRGQPGISGDNHPTVILISWVILPCMPGFWSDCGFSPASLHNLKGN